MPRVKVADMPKVARSGRVSKYAVQMDELEELLSETTDLIEDDEIVEDDEGNAVQVPTYGAGEAVCFDATAEDMDPLVKALRKRGEQLGRKVKVLFHKETGKLYAQDNGALEADKPESESSEAIHAAVAERSGTGTAAKPKPKTKAS